MQNNLLQSDFNSKIFNIGSIFCFYYRKGFFWFRFFNSCGLWGKSNKVKTLELFSERNGYVKYYKVFGWKFKLLK